ncbi:hypothetical protein SK128_023360, partial [Halocaridina rubra]
MKVRESNTDALTMDCSSCINVWMQLSVQNVKTVKEERSCSNQCSELQLRLSSHATVRL